MITKPTLTRRVFSPTAPVAPVQVAKTCGQTSSRFLRSFLQPLALAAALSPLTSCLAPFDRAYTFWGGYQQKSPFEKIPGDKIYKVLFPNQETPSHYCDLVPEYFINGILTIPIRLAMWPEVEILELFSNRTHWPHSPGPREFDGNGLRINSDEK